MFEDSDIRQVSRLVGEVFGTEETGESCLEGCVEIESIKSISDNGRYEVTTAGAVAVITST